MRLVHCAALALCLLAVTSAAQEVESVTVYGGTLAGIWKVEGPSWLQINLFGSIKWGPLRSGFCRIDKDADGYTTHCYRQRGSGGTLEVDGTHFHLAWGTMLARMVFDGEVQSATHFSGKFAAKLMGIPITDPDMSEGDKLDIRPDAPDADGRAPLLRAVLSGEMPAHDPALEENLAAARTMNLGGIEAIVHLGTQGKLGGPSKAPDPTYLSVYAVEFEKGERLCWLHQKDDKSLEAFECA